MSRRRIRPIVVIAAVAVLAANCAKKPAPRLPIRVVTTPELAATGLVQHLASVFGTQSGAHVDVVPSGADVVITNDPAAIAAMKREGRVRLASTVASDQYFIAGPARNPAHLSRSDDAVEAFRRIFARRQRFCSFVDVAPVHDREQRIWAAASLTPDKNRRYLECKGNAAVALRKASLAGAYVVVDRATFDSVQPKNYSVLIRGGPLLANDVAVLLIEKPQRSKDADWFVEWMMSYRGRDAIESYRPNGEKRYYVEH